MEKAPVELVSLAAEAVHTASTVGPEWPVPFCAARPVEVTGDQVGSARWSTTCSPTSGPTRRRGRRRPAGGPGGRRGRGRGARHRTGHAGRGGAPRVRALLPGRPGPGSHSGGTGLGLSIVAAIVATHRGTVSATWAPGQGTTVIVRIPMSPVELDVEQAEAGADTRGSA